MAAAGTVVAMIEINGLTRSFGAAGISDVSFTGRPGSVTGFLGPNGAGKTTTMRLLCGLDRPDAGTATIDGHPYARLPQPGRRVGVMLDPGAMHRGRTGRETLALAAAMLGVDRSRVARVLELVGLDSAALSDALRAAGRQASVGADGAMTTDAERETLLHAQRVLADPLGRRGTVQADQFQHTRHPRPVHAEHGGGPA